MSKFFSSKYDSLTPYVPGEQPKNTVFIKLNTNESPYPPSERVLLAVKTEAEKLQLYSDPECYNVRNALAKLYNVGIDNVIVSNGSDEMLNFAFMAYGDDTHAFAFPNISYGFYPVFAEQNRVPYEEIPLTDSFDIDVNDYLGIGKTIVIANPNAPTGKALTLDKIELLAKSNPDNVVIIDEAYVDFGAESAIELTKKYANLMVVGTFSKSRSMAGARLGFAIANKELISDLNTLRYSLNPYNVNRMTLSAGEAAIIDNDYYMENCKKIIKAREYTTNELKKLGFTVLDSKANFIFAKSDKIDGETLYNKLRQEGILVRHFTNKLISNFNRISIGTEEQMKTFIQKVEKILKETT